MLHCDPVVIVLQWETFTRELPYPGLNAFEVVLEVVNNQATPGVPQDMPEPWADLMQRCWRREHSERPQFDEIVEELENMGA